MFEKRGDLRSETALDCSTNLAWLREDIAKGMSDVQACRVSVIDMASIKAAGRATLNARCKNRRSSFFERGASAKAQVIGRTAPNILL